MKQLLVACLMLETALVSSAFGKEPTNLDVTKTALVQYHDSSDYAKDIDHTIKQALRYLSMRLAHPALPGKKPAIVLDIDETALSNYEALRQHNFGGTREDFTHIINAANGRAIEPTLKLYQFARAQGVAVFFITARYTAERVPTEENLRKAGYATWNGIFFLNPKDYKHRSYVPYKTAARKQITEQGYDIILNIGDQKSDLAGGYADKNFKLPNPYYFTR